MPVVVAIALGALAEPPHVPAGMGRMLPRVPGPAPSIRVLLHMLGVGSVSWYAVTIGFPILLWCARRIDTEKFDIARTSALSFIALLVGTAQKSL